MQALCAVLEFDICDSAELKLQIAATLQATARGRGAYSELGKRQILLQEIVRPFLHNFLLTPFSLLS